MSDPASTRHGECNNCGWCCQFISLLRVTVPERDVNPDTEQFYALRRGIKGDDGKIRFVSHQFLPCTAHDDTGKRCTVYEQRPSACRAFPSVPDQIEGTPCSYWFVAPDGTKRGGLGSPFPTPPRFRDLSAHFQQKGDPSAKPVDEKEMWPAALPRGK